jgi:hypothetical protein
MKNIAAQWCEPPSIIVSPHVWRKSSISGKRDYLFPLCIHIFLVLIDRAVRQCCHNEKRWEARMGEAVSPEEGVTALMADARVLPLARILHYAKREATANKLSGTAQIIDQAILSLMLYSDTPVGRPS